MTSPRVSVCVLTYNHERYIRDCLMTVVAQANDVPLEILVGDDQSSDLTQDIVRGMVAQFPEVIRYFRHEKRLGAGGNYQFLIRQVRGEYIAYLDGDDYWLPGKLAAQVSVLDDSPECVAAYTNAICVNDAGQMLGVFNNPLAERFDLEALLHRGNFLNHSSVLYRAGMADSICQWEPDFIDYRIHLLLAQHGQLAYLRAPYVGYRVNTTGSMLADQHDRVKELYWSALCETLTPTIDKGVRVAAMADFLSGAFLRAFQTGRLNFLIHWWRVVTREYKCNKIQLAFLVAMIAIRRQSLSLLGKYSGSIAGLPFRIFHRR
ncbi:glycosyltransferase [Dechloromonas sp. H13]|uniref:glycosyltransferase n=1 Tax=Dechloromonas sp. H13 TaxID=2570193 RepID=UPI0012908F93|nr:glycosyltransferase [Dechloromonas sp. H13]